jgi:amino acid transporter
VLIGAAACISPFFGRTTLVWLIDAGSFALIIAYAMVALAFLRLRQREPDMARPFRAGRAPLVGWLALGLALAIGLVYLPGSPAALLWPWEWSICLAWAAAGIALWAARKTSQRSQ